MKSKKKLLTAATLGGLGLAGPVAGHPTSAGKALTQPLTGASMLGSGAAKKKAARRKHRRSSSNANKSASSANKNKR